MSTNVPALRKGARVRVTYEGKTLDATVLICSTNGRSLAIGWSDGMLGGHVGMMPILHEGGEYRSLIEGKRVLLALLS